MQYRQPSQSEIISHIKGLENVHCALEEPTPAKEFYASLFGAPAHVDGDWSEFKVSGFDFAVTYGKPKKFVITFKVEGLEELRSKLERLLSLPLVIKHGEYGNYVEVCPSDGFCLHFFESKKKSG